MSIFTYPFRTTRECPQQKPVVPVAVYNPANGFEYKTWALIDTGADTTVIPEYVAKALYHNIRHPKVKREENFGIGGRAEVYMHTFSINILFSDSKGNIDENKIAIKIPKRKFAVVSDLHIIILGEKDFLKKYILTIDYPRQIFSIKKPTKN